MSNQPDDDMLGFGARLREWGGRPPETPAPDAARQVTERLSRPVPLVVRLRPALAAAVAAVALTVALWGVRGAIQTSPASRPFVEDAPAPLPDNVVQWWLDPETPVYFVTGPAEGGGTQ